VTRAARSPAAGAGAILLLNDGGALGDDVATVLRARGLAVEVSHDRVEVAVARGGHVAAALAEPPDAAAAATLAPACRGAAESGRPVILLVPIGRGGGKAALERAAALAHLRAHGAIVVADPDAWIEAIVLVARFGLPAGPRTSVIAPPGGWLAASARAQAAEADPSGDRAPSIAAVAADVEPADVVLVDRAASADVPSARAARALVVPVIARGELLDGDDVLVGLRAALAAVASCGRAAERLAAGLGPAPHAARAELEIDDERVARQLGRLASSDRRIGDHEAKVLLSAYGVPVIRQAVATTPSAATRLAKKAGYPVELKPWGPDVPAERAGCPVERDLATASDVRRAYLSVLGAAGLPVSESGGAAVIVRETPPAGREVSASFVRIGALGWTVLVEVANQPPIAAPAPLRLVDAISLAAAVTASRAGDPEPDRVALANLLRRTSHLAVDQDAFDRVDLGRIIVAPKGSRTLVIDAEILLR